MDHNVATPYFSHLHVRTYIRTSWCGQKTNFYDIFEPFEFSQIYLEPFTSDFTVTVSDINVFNFLISSL